MPKEHNIPSLFDHSGNLTLSAMERYLQDALDQQERDLVEAHLANSPFEREAIEGMRKQGTPEFHHDIKEIDEKILELAAEKKASASPRSKPRYYWVAAAGITAIVSLSFLLVFMFRASVENAQLADVVKDTVRNEKVFNEEPAQRDLPAEEEKAVGSKLVSRPDPSIQETPPATNQEALYQVVEERPVAAEPITEQLPPVPANRISIVENDIARDDGSEKEAYTVGGVAEQLYDVDEESALTSKKAKGEVSYMIQADGALKTADEEEPAEENDIFTVVEKMPEFPGGDTALYNFLAENLRYPAEAKEGAIQGRVFLTFIVETDGKVDDIKVLRGIGGGCDEEAVRVVGLMPNWIPGKQRGKPVRVQYNLPIMFSLE